MTEAAQEVAHASAAQQAGEAADANYRAHAEAMLAAPDDTTDSARSLDDQAVVGIGTSSEPQAVSPQPSSSPNVLDPLDNSQSQP